MPAGTIDALGIKNRVRSRLVDRATAELDMLSPPERRLRVRSEVMEVLREAQAILPASEVSQVVNQVSDEVVGLGPIERLLKDPEVSEVMVNGADDVYVERKGQIDRAVARLAALGRLFRPESKRRRSATNGRCVSLATGLGHA